MAFVFKDDQYPQHEIKQTRRIIRAVLLDENDNVILERVSRNDIFGNYQYLETPGGGVEPYEDDETCLKREIKEEIGADIEVLRYLDEVDDYYNLLGRKNINVYYLAKVIKYGKPTLEKHELVLIQGVSHLNIEDAILELEKYDSGIAKLVQRRELPILLQAYKILKGDKKQ